MHSASVDAGAARPEPRHLLTTGLAAIVEWLLRRDEAVRARTRLHAMSDHMLKDVGLTRELIDDALRGNLTRD
jgi:uncharacterized protein YjiS (DUF1127 family)